MQYINSGVYSKEEAITIINETKFSQPTLICLQYSLAMMMKSFINDNNDYSNTNNNNNNMIAPTDSNRFLLILSVLDHNIDIVNNSFVVF